MSFRSRLTSFFILIVVIPMVAVGFLVFRLISDSQQGKADARANGLATAAGSLYGTETVVAADRARGVARALAGQGGPIAHRAAVLASRAGLVRVEVRLGGRRVADIGSRAAVAPGTAVARLPGSSKRLTVTVSALTAAQFVHQMTGPGVGLVVREGGRTLAWTHGMGSVRSSKSGGLTVRGVSYRAITAHLPGFGGPISLTVLSPLSAAATGSVTGSKVVAAAFILAVLLLAFAFAVMASRGLQGQISRFLQAAKRLASGDFSSPIQTEGKDEFAALGEEFNNMSSQLERRLAELSQERARLRGAVQRIGQTFASNLDRPALLELALKTAIDGIEASGGRVRAGSSRSETFDEIVQEGSLAGLEAKLEEAEAEALRTDGFGEATSEQCHVLSVPLGTPESGGGLHGLITVVRAQGTFSEDDRTVLRSLAAQAGLALENVELHVQVSRQAVTDELTGLSNHRRFQELLTLEMEQVRRYHHPVGLIMLDIDNFKSVNDTYGHQQGDIVLRRVARVLADNSREPDVAARYGGEELALILPHTDLDGAFAIAERIRVAVESSRVPRVDQQGVLRVTASLGVAALTDGSKEDLIRDADAALYEAKRNGKNRTVRAAVAVTDALRAG